MPLFQVSSRIVQSPAGSRQKRPTRIRRWLYVILRVVVGGLVIAALATLLGKVGLSFLFFLLLPVCVSLITARTSLYNRNTLLLTISLSLLYFSSITGWELLTHGPNTPEIVVVTTTLALAVLFEPLRTYIQTFIEQRFHLRDNEAIKVVEAFISTLREEIDLNKVREDLFSVVQQTMQPQSVSLWVRKAAQQNAESSRLSSRWGERSEQTQREECNQQAQAPATGKLVSTEHAEFAVAADDPLLAYALNHPSALQIDQLQLTSPVLQDLKRQAVEVILPFVSQGELIGLLSLGPRLKGMEYTRESRALLNTLASQVSPALRVAQMVQVQQAEARERERIEQELRTVQTIQHTFLPKDVPAIPGWQIVPYYQSAREVGGDFYDFLPFEDGHLGLVIGDVSGKGIPAALVMTATRTMLRTAAQEKASPREVLARVNDLLSMNIPSSMFATCFYALLDLKSGRLRYANAGQDLPFRLHCDGVSELWATGMPLGMMPGSSYEEYEVTIAPGESLLFYSDGLVEAHNSRHEMFDTPRLKALLQKHAGGASLIDFLLGELNRFTGEGWEQEDDVTMVLVRSLSPEKSTP